MRTAVSAIALFACSGAFAQTFDAVSIRPANRDARAEVQTASGSLTIRNQSLSFLIRWAWDMPPFQVVAPASTSEERFDVVAKGRPTSGDLELRQMLRTVLEERFHVKTHLEQKEMQVYELSLAKGGPKFHETTEPGEPVFDRGGPTTLTAHRVRMKDLAVRISEPLGRPVIDVTGLKGRYEIKLDVSAYMLNAANGDTNLDVMSILFTGLQQQLGVKLESKKESVDILTVDSADRTPTEN